jgi:hypothetical protein
VTTEIDDEDDRPDEIGYSLANLSYLLLACLDAADAGSVIEVGSDRGLLTEELLEWASPDRKITAIDPAPHARLERVEAEHPELELLRETSHEALRRIDLADAIILDGDHNYFTLSGELDIIGERAPGASMPLLLFHDVGWPHARRDSYYVPERIPDEHRQPITTEGAIEPGNPGIIEDGLPFDCAAVHEGGPRNGVLTAIEDFVASREGLELVTVPGFFGFGVVWHSASPFAESMADLLRVWDRNPLLERLEANRVTHLVERLRAFTVLKAQHEELARYSQRLSEQEALLRGLLDSGTFAVAERLSGLRHRGEAPISRNEIRRVLDGG